MGKLLYSETRDNGNCDCVHEDPTQLQNTLTENVPCPCPLTGMVTNNRGLTERYISKTRGVPSMGSTNYGPRGARQNFRSDTDPTDDMYRRFTGTNWQQSGRNRETMWQNGGVFSNAIGATQGNSGCEGQCGNVNGTWYGSCATCGPGCNCDCINGKCTKVAREGSKVRAGGYSRFAGDSRGTMMTMNVSNLVMGYLAIGLTAFVIGYSIKKGKELA